MNNIDLYIKIIEILFMLLLEVQIIKYFLGERSKNIKEFNKVNIHKSISKERAFKK